MPQQSKTITYLGFSMKAGKVVYGIDAAENYRKRVYLLVACGTLSENSMKDAVKLQKKFKCALLVTQGVRLEELLHRANCKFIALTDKNLCDAIKAQSTQENDFRMYPWEETE